MEAVVEKWIKIVCESCKQKLKIQAKHANKRGKCPKCKTECPIPEYEEELFIIEDDIEEDFNFDDDLIKEFARIDEEYVERKRKKTKI